ncbi:MAG TPA: thioredoxin family protein [Prolixibacteraceae bacterium]|nr:thioredoxin family protein [Prolixibacteraceae bacterium]
MNLRFVESGQSLYDTLSSRQKAYLLFVKTGSEQSDCFLSNLHKASDGEDEIPVYTIDVNRIHDIHTRFSVHSVPTLLELEGGKVVRQIKGCQPPSYLRSLFQNHFFRAKAESKQKTQPRVVVYSTPSCSWCRTLKRYLDDKQIRYTDIDVSADSKKAEEMVRMSGQQGVPQTLINGTMVVGFNQERINQLLGI